MDSETKPRETSDTVVLRALPEGGFVISFPGRAPGFAALDVKAVADVDGLTGWVSVSYLDTTKDFYAEMPARG